MGESFFSRAHFDSVYIPAGLLLFGTWIVKQEFIPYAAALALALGGYRFYDLSRPSTHAKTRDTVTDWHSSPEEGAHPDLPGVRAPGEDGYIPQCCHVSLTKPVRPGTMRILTFLS